MEKWLTCLKAILTNNFSAALSIKAFEQVTCSSDINSSIIRTSSPYSFIEVSSIAIVLPPIILSTSHSNWFPLRVQSKETPLGLAKGIVKSIILDIGSEIFPIRVKSPVSWQSSWLIDSIVNLGTIFGASVGLSGLIGEVVVLSVVVVDEEELGVFVGEGVFEEDWLSVGVGVFEGDGV